MASEAAQTAHHPLTPGKEHLDTLITAATEAKQRTAATAVNFESHYELW